MTRRVVLIALFVSVKALCVNEAEPLRNKWGYPWHTPETMQQRARDAENREIKRGKKLFDYRDVLDQNICLPTLQNNLSEYCKNMPLIEYCEQQMQKIPEFQDQTMRLVLSREASCPIDLKACKTVKVQNLIDHQVNLDPEPQHLISEKTFEVFINKVLNGIPVFKRKTISVKDLHYLYVHFLALNGMDERSSISSPVQKRKKQKEKKQQEKPQRIEKEKKLTRWREQQAQIRRQALLQKIFQKEPERLKNQANLQQKTRLAESDGPLSKKKIFLQKEHDWQSQQGQRVQQQNMEKFEDMLLEENQIYLRQSFDKDDIDF